jgi:hypothetical protein
MQAKSWSIIIVIVGLPNRGIKKPETVARFGLFPNNYTRVRTNNDQRVVTSYPRKT